MSKIGNAPFNYTNIFNQINSLHIKNNLVKIEIIDNNSRVRLEYSENRIVLIDIPEISDIVLPMIHSSISMINNKLKKKKENIIQNPRCNKTDVIIPEDKVKKISDLIISIINNIKSKKDDITLKYYEKINTKFVEDDFRIYINSDKAPLILKNFCKEGFDKAEKYEKIHEYMIKSISDGNEKLTKKLKKIFDKFQNKEFTAMRDVFNSRSDRLYEVIYKRNRLSEKNYRDSYKLLLNACMNKIYNDTHKYNENKMTEILNKIKTEVLAIVMKTHKEYLPNDNEEGYKILEVEIKKLYEVEIKKLYEYYKYDAIYGNNTITEFNNMIKEFPDKSINILTIIVKKLYADRKRRDKINELKLSLKNKTITAEKYKEKVDIYMGAKFNSASGKDGIDKYFDELNKK